MSVAHKLKDKEALKRYQELCKRISDNTEINPFETSNDKKTRVEKAIKDFKFFVETYFKHYCDSETPEFHIRIARKVRRNPKVKVWLQWARGHAKSVVAIVLLPLWLWINGEIKFLLVIGQNEDKAKILLGDLQAEFEHNKLLIHDFGKQKNLGSWEDGFFVTLSGFKAKAMGMGQDPRGIRVGKDRPDMIVADDLEIKETAKNPKRQDEIAEWFMRGVIPAMDNGNRRVLIAQNYWTPRMIFTKIVEENEAWEIDRVNGYDPETYMPTWSKKYSRWHFKEVEQEIGSVRAKAEYNNEPHVEGKYFLEEYKQWAPIPQIRHFDAIVGRWDIAYGGTKSSDYNAVRIWGIKDGKKYLIDCFVKQSKITAALEWIADFQSQPNHSSIQVGFEAQFWNDEIYRLIDETEKKFNCRLNLVKIERRRGNKLDAIMEMLPEYQNGRVYYNEKLKSHNDTQQGWIQLLGIEPGYSGHDDAPDADKYAFDYLNSFSRQSRYTSLIRKSESRKF